MTRPALMTLCVMCFGLIACSEPVEGPYLTFAQNGAPVEATLADGVYEITLKAAQFTVTPHPDLFEGDAFDSKLGLTVGREALLRRQVQDCQSLIDGPFFESLNKFATSADPLDTLFLDTASSGERFGWHYVGPDDSGIDNAGAFTIKSIVDLKNDEAEVLRAGEEIFLISYDFPSTWRHSWHRCDPPEGADTSQGIVDSRRMQFWRLVFE